jgi:hypothetical protein
MLHLWFWTNVMWSYNGTDYDESKIVPIGMTGYFIEMVDPATGLLLKNLKSVLCYATGVLQHSYVTGGFLSGFQGIQVTEGSQGYQGFQNAIYDLIPIFTRPKIILNIDTTSPDSIGMGMITDGWYEGSQGGYQGATGPTGTQGYQGTQGPRGPQGFQGFQGFLSGEGQVAFREGGTTKIMFLWDDDFISAGFENVEGGLGDFGMVVVAGYVNDQNDRLRGADSLSALIKVVEGEAGKGGESPRGSQLQDAIHHPAD